MLMGNPAWARASSRGAEPPSLDENERIVVETGEPMMLASTSRSTRRSWSRLSAP